MTDQSDSPPALHPTNYTEMHLQNLGVAASNLAQMHARFLEARQSILNDTAGLVRLHMQALHAQTPTSSNAKYQDCLFDRTRLDEFAQGSVVRCFGPEYQVFEGRRIPRIPNGDFLLMSRILSIQGSRHVFDTRASITSEVEVPEDPWYFAHHSSPDLPYSILMEIAMQPCGFLSAYLGTSFLLPTEDLYFRNLDGQAHFHKRLDTRGKTITNQATLTSTTVSGNTIIQKFQFVLSCMGIKFYSGEAVFGYFSREAMDKQIGLDGGIDTLPVITHKPANRQLMPSNSMQILQKPSFQPPKSRLVSLDHVQIFDHPEDTMIATILAEQAIDPSDWYFKSHFYQDPVMPGSLGVEAVLSILQMYALDSGLGKGLKSPRFGQVIDQSISWKYRGQIIPSHHKMTLKVNIEAIKEGPSGTVVIGNASIWTDRFRIYEINQAAVEVIEAE